MPYCFVIQPFDGAKFDKRYTDVFKPAIEAAGLDAYRVDRDPSVNIPINDIEDGIRKSAVCFAEITLNNPNVWYELGFALASEKQICMVCSKDERQEKFPFDVQHRNIIRYGVDSPSDWKSLETQITERLRAIQEKTEKLAIFATKSPIKEEHGLSQHEMMVLATILENRDGPGDPVSHYTVKNGLDVLGYNNIALNIGIERLLKRIMISVTHDEDQNGNRHNLYSVEEAGMAWLIDNYESLNLGSNAKTTKSKKETNSWSASSSNDEIPF